eukprot:NODE_2953_length_392_cov_24.040816_g2871_i0.p2 GENE.NODE_2953_length_392_cov_24.040816_g2871_i0~~NODE_2953_length_392_cov_24.040816_g2871_i0.p2  ORF type:complete len:57 (-),score=14.37 NODE_2953_length_392_cov_24.040816_g2871_i0:221-367(-)
MGTPSKHNIDFLQLATYKYVTPIVTHNVIMLSESSDLSPKVQKSSQRW